MAAKNFSNKTKGKSVPESQSVIQDFDETTNFPFLIDTRTAAYIGKCKVMFIMRGLPGSGKSYLVSLLQEVYPDVVVCSADHYFNRTGEYKFSKDELSYAHEDCHQKAEQACTSGINNLIIDNTNIRRWEMQFYFKLAKTHGYIVTLVSPKTDWRLDANVLAQYNKHNVPADVLRKKVKDFQHLVPLYYGWFLNESDSTHLINRGQNILQECFVKFPAMKQYILGNSGQDVSTYFKRYEESKLVHCTAKFCFHGKVKDADVYDNMNYVQQSHGKCFPFEIVGFVITPETFSARIKLSESQLPLYHKPEETENFCSSCFNSPSRKSTCSDHKNYAKMTTKSCLVKFSGHGRTAHVTLGCAAGIQAKETNNSLLSICQIESEVLQNSYHGNTQTVTLKHSEAVYYDDGYCAVYLTEPSRFSSLFCGQY